MSGDTEDLLAYASVGIRYDNILPSIQRLSATKPEEIALLHKRRGHWLAFRWLDVQREVARLRDSLARNGASDGVRLAVSGAYEPDLIFISLAAYALDGQVFPVARDIRGNNLTQALATIRPTHAFVQSRRNISQWLGAGTPGDSKIPLFSSQSIPRHGGNWEVVPLHPLPAKTSAPRQAGDLRAYLKRHNIVWVDEGTEWHAGLQSLLDRWLTDGAAIAFPETGESGARDRQEVQPTTLLSSPARRHQLEQEIRNRLPAEGSWSRKLCDYARADPDRAIAGLVNARLDDVLGLRRAQQRQLEYPRIVNA